MEKIDGKNLKHTLTPEEIITAEGREITLCACVHKIKKSGGFYFVLLRTGRYVYQTVYRAGKCKGDFAALCEGAYISVSGTVKKEERAPYGFEIELTDFEILSKPKSECPFDISASHLGVSIETSMEHRFAALRNPEERAVFKICEGVTTAFSSFMQKNGFTEIHTPKLTTLNMEDKKHAFRLKYFGETAYLAQSPQLYKQAAVAFFERVFEVGSAYRADKHNSTRHLNEFISLDFEMAYAAGLHEIMAVITAFLKHAIKYLNKNYQNELQILGVTLTEIKTIPCITFDEALEILCKPKKQPDLDPTDEVKICKWAREKFKTDLIFIEKFPQKKRPFYVMGSKGNPKLTETFDLIFDGKEIASGSLRLNDYDELTVKIKRMGIDEAQYAPYLDMFLCGMPPHGGAAIGLERLVMQLLGLDDIRQASLFPRDLHHITP
ncbi:MAG: aspartate--tRNA(Asn) ligase [Clostridia bacterium]|nr:aspartate--tRNA(Asn) ligase [Clostridia bacterium]